MKNGVQRAGNSMAHCGLLEGGWWVWGNPFQHGRSRGLCPWWWGNVEILRVRAETKNGVQRAGNCVASWGLLKRGWWM